MTFEIYSFCLIKAGAGIYSEKSFNGKYMLEVVAAKKHSSTAKMETVPGFSLLIKNRDERLNSESGADFYLFWCND